MLVAAAALLIAPQLPGGMPLRVVVAVLLGLRSMHRVVWVLLMSRRHEAVSDDTVSFIQDLAEGRFTTTFKSISSDKTGEVQRALLTLRIKMGYQIAEERRKASLLRQALDSASASIMLADENLRVVYTNTSANRLFQNLEGDLRTDLPAFQADKVIGSYMDVFYRNPDHHLRALAELKEASTADGPDRRSGVARGDDACGRRGWAPARHDSRMVRPHPRGARRRGGQRHCCRCTRGRTGSPHRGR